ncbi:LmbE family N-acetylglucosaminyl deacetylase [Nocardiopsis sp. Huas11]|uniref:PIG-L deacetylase family protein n=1 Tax=Nocardiopsis sp. Huas11 TaxID=2183912 RepID=UPI000EAE9F0D|nr:PIG-L family deacetylase [Nocardiopsis sp. Huas11]RKS07037.1 LmbE family N-acetylglucosaminyl deacetylase [Nocardiopsis sp. Huas11]
MPAFGLPIGSRALIIAPHPDDETLGAGGTLARLAREGVQVHVLVLGAPCVDADLRAKEFDAACRVLRATDHLIASKVPADPYDLVGFIESGTRMGLDRLAPELLLLPAAGSHHHDHRRGHEAALAAARPRTGAPGIVLGYRGPDDHWPEPVDPGRISVDTTRTRSVKYEALDCYASQLRPDPHPRSLPRIHAVESTAGARAGVDAAEQFCVYRMVV